MSTTTLPSKDRAYGKTDQENLNYAPSFGTVAALEVLADPDPNGSPDSVTTVN
ncbi:MAG TPA: hypothetical protein VFP34_07465 [Microlunatus sp.]|nr:hypothetical protein [Microlunatus sp.]